MKPELVKAQPRIYNQIEIVAIRSRIDARFLVTGAVTGKQYEWPRSGAVVDVDAKDAEEILNKKRGRGCCGNENADPHLFERA